MLKNKILYFLLLVFSLLLFYYVMPQSQDFPTPPAGSIQSFEPADVETPYRRGYYTNLNRQEIISHYENEFNRGFRFYKPRLNYPVEDAPVFIRDQTKSTYLEEIVHPLRESLYVNGFEPKTEEYALVIDGVRWNQKVIIRYVPSNLYIRIVTVALITLTASLLLLEYRKVNE